MSIFHTERLTLRPFKKDDAQAMYKSWTYDNRVAKYCRWYPHTSLDMTQQLLEMYLEEIANGFEYRWAIELTETGKLIGAIDVVDISNKGQTATIGYVLAYDYWNNGYMTEALRQVIQELFKNGFTLINAEHHIENIASGRVMEKCGMTFTHYDKSQAKFGSDELCDVKCYQIKKGDI